MTHLTLRYPFTIFFGNDIHVGTKCCWNTNEESASYRFSDMFKKAVKHFDYNDVLELSTVVDTEYRTFKHNVYYH